MIAKKKYKKREVREQIIISLQDIQEIVGEFEKFPIHKTSPGNESGIAVLMYDLNRLSAQVLSLLKTLGLPIKTDVNYLESYADNPFMDENFASKIDLKVETFDLAE